MRESVCSEADTGALVVLLLCALASSACLADAASELERGRQLYEARDYEGAIQVLNPVVSADAALAPEALKWIASCYYEQRKYPEAIAGARTRVELVTPRGERETIKDARGQLATALRDGGEIEAAVDLYRALLDDYPELASAYYYGLGICRKARWSYEQAAVEFTDSEKSAPHQTMANIAFLEVSECVFRQGKPSQAIAMAKARLDSAVATGDRQTEREMKGRLADYYCDTGDYDVSIPIYEECLAAWPDNTAEYQYGLGTCYQGKGDNDKALSYFKQSVTNSKIAWAAMVQAAGCLARQGKTAEADALVQKASADYSFARSQVMLLHAEVTANYVKDYEKAAAVLRQVIAVYSGYPTIVWDARVRLALLTLWQLGNPGEARAMLTEMLTAPNLHPAEEARLKYYLAYCSYAEENWAAAREAFQSMYESYATGAFHASGKYMVGDCSMRLGDTQAARQAFDEVVARFPDCALASHARRQLDSMSGKTRPPSEIVAVLLQLVGGMP